MKVRKQKRIKGLILALATAVVLVPTAGARVYQGGSMGYVTVNTATDVKADYSGLSQQALQAMNERWEKLADQYTASSSVRPDDRAGVRGVARSTQVPDLVDRQVANIDLQTANAVRPDNKAGLHGPGPIDTPALVSSHDGGFDWTDAGIGASTAVFAAALLAAATMSRRRTGLPA
jgi:hypothetical protein